MSLPSDLTVHGPKSTERKINKPYMFLKRMKEQTPLGGHISHQTTTLGGSFIAEDVGGRC